MAKPITIDTTKGNVSWSIEINNLMVVIYDAFVKDKSGVLKDSWEKQSTFDNPEKKIISQLTADKLASCCLYRSE